MKRSLVLCCMLLTYAHNTVIAQNNVHFTSYNMFSSDKSFFRLGDNVVTIKKQGDASLQPFVFINLHHNEVTGSSAALDFIEKNGGQMISLENNFQKLIAFEMINKSYSFDPNQIFTKHGRAATLRTGPYKNMVAVEIQRFAHFFIEELPEDKILVAMHNHDNQEWGLSRFEKGKWKRMAKALYINPEMDEDDYFVTTDEYIFNQLKEKKLNVMLHNVRSQDDGSLIYYYGRLNKMYVDIVTEFGHYEQQQKMVAALAAILK